MSDEMWHVEGTIMDGSPGDILMSIFEADHKIYQKAQSELAEDLGLLDKAISLYIESIQGAYRVQEKWGDNVGFQAAIAMANSILNLLLLCRHGVLLGYFAETQHLLRSCHERITRCYLFFIDEKSAEKFLGGGEIGQSDVDRKLSELLSDNSNEKSKILKALRDSYGMQSQSLHPNLSSFAYRTGGSPENELRQRIVTDPLYGGLLSKGLGKSTIMAILKTALFALMVIKTFFVESRGQLEKDFDQVKREFDGYLSTIKKDIGTSQP